VGLIQAVPADLVNMGRIVPKRAALVASPRTIAYPAVTIGDSALATVQISNAGNSSLFIDQIESPDAEIHVLDQTPFYVLPGQARDVGVLLTPTRPLSVLGPLRIRGNDPARPVLEVPIVTDVRAIAIATQLANALLELPLGEAVSVIATPAPGVHVERGKVHYRGRGAVAGDSLSLVAGPSNFFALIPGGSVTEAGLEWYVRVENSGIFATDPPGAPDSTFFHPVAAPVGVASAARADLAGEYPIGRPVPIEVALPQGSSFQSGKVYYRPGGAAEYDSLDLSLVEVAPGVIAPAGTINGSAIGPRGLEYRVHVETLTRTLSDPPSSAGDRTRSVRTNVGNLEESTSHTGGRYRMVSVPLALSLPADATLEAILSDQSELGTYDPTRWRSYRYLPEEGAYRELSAAAAADGALRPEPGRAFWMIARQAHRINTAPVAGRSTPTDTSYRVTLGAGWNQVGNPYAFRVAWSSVRAESAGVTIALEPPVAWDEAAGAYRPADVTVLEPFEGYWVRNPSSGPVELVIAPDEAAAGVVAGALASASPGEPADSSAWRVGIAALCGTARDLSNLAGVAAQGREGQDALDRSEPPVVPGAALSLYFIADDAAGGAASARRTADIRSLIPSGGEPATRGHRWVFDVVRSGSDELPPEVSLAFRGLDRVPSDLGVRLVDRLLERTVDLRQAPEYTLAGARTSVVTRSSEARFELQVGTEEYLAAVKSGLADRPRVTRLLPSFPNPVASWAIIRFETARAGRVSVSLYDVAGRRVRTLVAEEREAGLYELAWRGDGDDGRTLAAGVYSLRLVAPDRTDVRKLIKIR
jgi:hypothetical protein